MHIPAAEKISLKLDKDTLDQLNLLAASSGTTLSAIIRKQINIGLQKELAKESVDYIREQINAEVKAVCIPQFERLAKLSAKIGYQTVSSFYLLSYIIDCILPSAKAVQFGELKRRSRAMAVAYLKFSEREFEHISKSDEMAQKELELTKNKDLQ